MNTIYTFGYGNRANYNALSQYLIEYEITRFVDVRLSPKGWSRIWWADELNEFCNQNKVLYLNMPALGNTTKTAEWVPPDASLAKMVLKDLSFALQSSSILLMCAELDHKRCHRTVVAEQLSNLSGCPVLHLT